MILPFYKIIAKTFEKPLDKFIELMYINAYKFVSQTSLYKEDKMKDNDLSQVTKRTAGYWYVDGLAEIGTGIVFLVLGVFYLVLAGFEPGGVSSLIVAIGQPAIILLGVYGLSRVVRYFKERITFPRTGYVSYRRKPQSVRRKKVILSGTIAATLAVVITLMFLDLLHTRIWLVAGVLGALVPVLFGYSLGLPRFYLIAVLMVGWSIVINILPELSEMTFAVLFYGGMGVIVTASGIFTLLRYLRTTQPVTEVQDE